MDYYGTRLATCSSDRSVKIFDVKPSGQQILLADLQGFKTFLGILKISKKSENKFFIAMKGQFGKSLGRIRCLGIYSLRVRTTNA